MFQNSLLATENRTEGSSAKFPKWIFSFGSFGQYEIFFSILLEHSIFEDSFILKGVSILCKREKIDYGFNLYFLGQKRLILIIQNMSVKR